MDNYNNKTQKTDEQLLFFEQKVNKLEQEKEVWSQEKEILEAKVKFYEEQLRLNQQQKYGSSSDKTDPEQLYLFNEAEKLSAKPSEEPKIEEVLSNRKTKKTKSRKTYEDLDVEEVYYTLSEEELVCPICEHSLHEMKTEVRKELKIIPAQVKVVHHIRQVYACRYCDDKGTTGTILTASMPKPVLAGSMVSPSVLAFIMEKKYNQALPLYRQEQSFINFGLDISRQNMANWIMHGANTWLQLMHDRLHVYLKQEPIIHADESPLKVLDEKENKKNFMWLYASAKTGTHPIYLYEYQPSRASKHPKLFLKGFNGYLQSDGYAGYNSVEDVVQIGCLAHGRRKYTDAIKALPKEADVSLTKANEGLNFFNRIYHLEKSFSDLTPDERYHARLKKTQPIIDEYKIWLVEQKLKTLPKSKLGEAIKYSINQWDKLVAFMKDGHISVDNNIAERAIKPFVIGRKNFLFSKSPKGATASATCYSIIETAKSNNLKPFQYLTYLFEQLPNIDITNINELDALLPWSNSIPEEIKLKTKEEK